MTDFYVDSAATGANDGTSPTDAWASILSVAGTASGDKIWIRRTHSESLGSAWTLASGNAGNVWYIGWPISGDEQFSLRPVAGQAPWDGDSTSSLPTINNNGQVPPAVTVGGGTNLRRIKINGTSSTAPGIDFTDQARPYTIKDGVEFDIGFPGAGAQLDSSGFLIEVDGLTQNDPNGTRFGFIDFIKMGASMSQHGSMIRNHTCSAPGTAARSARGVHIDGTAGINGGVVKLIDCDYSGILCLTGGGTVSVDSSNASCRFQLENVLHAAVDQDAWSEGNGFQSYEYEGMIMTSINDNQVQGAWKSRQHQSLLEKTSDTRTGGASFSIKLSPLNAAIVQSINPLCLFGYELEENMIVPLTASTATTITIYCAENTWASLTDDEVWLEVDYWDSGFTRATTKGSGSALTSDTSTWSGGEDAFKLSTTITASHDCAGRIRIAVNAFESGKYVLVDPLIETS